MQAMQPSQAGTYLQAGTADARTTHTYTCLDADEGPCLPGPRSRVFAGAEPQQPPKLLNRKEAFDESTAHGWRSP